MSESMLNSFIRLIAALSAITMDKNIKITRKYIAMFFSQFLDKRTAKQKLSDFEDFYNKYAQQEDASVNLQAICFDITKEFSVKHRFQLIINLFNFFSVTPIDFTSAKNIGANSPSLTNPIEQIAKWLNIDPEDFLNFRFFVSGQLHRIPKRENILIVAESDPKISDTKFYKHPGLKGYVTFLKISSANLHVFTYSGTSVLNINGKVVFSKQSYEFDSGTVINIKNCKSIYYGQIEKAFLQADSNSIVTLIANSISYQYPKSNQGIKTLSLKTSSGELTGIMGGSGVGKSTLIKLLCGNLEPQSGEVLINGHNLYNAIALHQGVVGVMHQEECLIEELTVFENLYHSAKVAMGNLSNSELVRLVSSTLNDLELSDFQNNMVGSPENRMLSGGQRKRLAIGMEIIRDPQILFVDEPTSGLSSADSLMVMRIFKKIALSGKVVIVNIHQPSSEVYRLFDTIQIIDKGGYPVFYGNPIEAILHFKRVSNRVDKNRSSCECCGNIKPEEIFELIEEQHVNEQGQKTAERKIEPPKWHELYLSNQTIDASATPEISKLPKIKYHKPSATKQFFAFFIRNFLTKIRNLEFLFFSILLPPVLSVIVSLFLRYSIPASLTNTHETYNLFANPNLPSFFLMCILASLFFGLIISCEDIVRDRRIIIREQSIGLSLKSFYNAKFLFLLILSAIQTIAFIIPGVLMLELKGVAPALWLVLGLLSLSGNLLGLILSSTLKSVVAIYILVPFLLIPQILFSGIVVSFDNLNSKFSSTEHVPLIGETMLSRWAMEASMVHYYKNNKYQKPFFTIDFRESELRYRLLHLMPELNQMAMAARENPQDITANDIETITNGLESLHKGQSLPNPSYIYSPWGKESGSMLTDYLAQARQTISNQYADIRHERDRLVQKYYPNTPEGRDLMTATRNKYHNRAIDDLVKNKHYPVPLIKQENKYIQKTDPIFQIYPSTVGQSHFLAAYKQLGNGYVETYWYNIAVMLIMVLGLYVVFITNLLPRVFNRK